jgi:putative ABC transport system substrate-binding protein
MRRREFIAALTGLAFCSADSHAQQQSRKIPRIGWLVPSPRAEQDNLEEYRRGMNELGYAEGRTVETTYLYAEGDPSRLDKLASTLVHENIDIIVTFSTPGCLAAKRATSTIPIVFAASSDPLSTGVVTSLGHPGGNITGLSVMATDLSAKRLGAFTDRSAEHSQHRCAMGLFQPGDGIARARNQTRRRTIECRVPGFRRT